MNQILTLVSRMVDGLPFSSCVPWEMLQKSCVLFQSRCSGSDFQLVRRGCQRKALCCPFCVPHGMIQAPWARQLFTMQDRQLTAAGSVSLSALQLLLLPHTHFQVFSLPTTIFSSRNDWLAWKSSFSFRPFHVSISVSGLFCWGKIVGEDEGRL